MQLITGDVNCYRPGSPGSKDYILLFNVYDTITVSDDLNPRTKTCLNLK